jgi:hypothetical protein
VAQHQAKKGLTLFQEIRAAPKNSSAKFSLPWLKAGQQALVYPWVLL